VEKARLSSLVEQVVAGAAGVHRPGLITYGAHDPVTSRFLPVAERLLSRSA
jgi:hypothetical protein